MVYYTYILKSVKTNGYYIGCTNDLVARINRHNKGLNKYTKNRGPWELVYKEEYNSLSEARRREMQIKSLKKRSAIEKLINGAFVYRQDIRFSF